MEKIIKIENKYFKLKNIPLGKFIFRVKERVDRPVLDEEDVSMELTGLCRTKSNSIITKNK